MRVSFDANLWPANEEDAPGADALLGCVLVLRDGTRLPSGEPAVGWRSESSPPKWIMLARSLDIRIARLEQAAKAHAKYDPACIGFHENKPASEGAFH
jgi:hypothetical protein